MALENSSPSPACGFTELKDESDFDLLSSPDGYISVCGFGSLLSERSARSTFPELRNFRIARLRGFRRVFCHTAPVFFERGIAKEDTGEISSLSVEPCEGESLVVTVFEIKRSEVPSFIEREHEFRFLAVTPEDLNGTPYNHPAVLCARYSDEEYFHVRCKDDYEILFQRYGRYNIHRIWRDDIFPCRVYLRHWPTDLEASSMQEAGSAITKVEGEERGQAGMSAEDGEILRYLDSMDSYLALADSLSSTLRQGWLELASARHSMGASRISPSSFDLKEHPAASVVQVNESLDTPTNENCKASRQFALLKWGFSEKKKFGSVEVENTAKLHRQLKNLSLRHRGSPEGQQGTSNLEIDFSTADEQIQKERSKSLSVFGAFVSPKLRSAQCSFERALDILIEMANAKTLMLAAFDQLNQRASHFDKGSSGFSATSDSV